MTWKSADDLFQNLQPISQYHMLEWRAVNHDLYFSKDEEKWFVSLGTGFGQNHHLEPQQMFAIENSLNAQFFKSRKTFAQALQSLFNIHIPAFYRTGRTAYTIPNSYLLLDGWQGDWGISPLLKPGFAQTDNMNPNHLNAWNKAFKETHIFGKSRKEVLQKMIEHLQSIDTKSLDIDWLKTEGTQI